MVILPRKRGRMKKWPTTASTVFFGDALPSPSPA